MKRIEKFKIVPGLNNGEAAGLSIPRLSGMIAPVDLALKRGPHMKKSIYGLTFEQLAEWLMEYGHKKSRASQVWDWLYRKRATEFSEMTDVNPECLRLLADHFAIQTLTEHIKQESVDGTIKFLFRLQDGNLIETVLMRHKFGLSVCVTTQVGCNIGCSFCASGLLAKSRDLSGGEIVEQIMKVQLHLDQAKHEERVSHVVVMGIGEPFDNYRNLVDFITVVKDPKGLAIGPRHITVSTSGLADKIKEFADNDLGVNLAVSLHAPNNELRTRIMKINRAIPIEKLMQAIDYYLSITNRRITFEYILLKDVNDQTEHALQLAELVGDRIPLVNVNLIPYNPVDEHSQYQRSEQESIRAFYDTLKKQGVSCSVRLEHGTDIDAACGQLRSKQIKASS
jgi:23S rRNA (adenine2503-C2)-methyltransferase